MKPRPDTPLAGPMTVPSTAPADNGLPTFAWRRMDGLGLIRARGPDAREFLQSQLSNDAGLVSAERAQLSGYCSPKGRLLAVFTVSQLESGDSFGLELPAELLPATLKRLRMFVLRSKLVLEDASSEWPALALAGPTAADTLQSLGLPAPADAWGAASADGVLVLRRPGAWPCYLLRAAPDRLAALERSLAGLPPLEESTWRLAELLAGIPGVRAATVEHFVPQTIDLDRAGGISFGKGCYPGQEIVARVHYLGRLKQRLFLADCPAGATPGMPVHVPGEAQAVGEIVEVAARTADGGQLAALSLNLAQAEVAGLRLGGPDGPPLLSPPWAAHPESKD